MRLIDADKLETTAYYFYEEETIQNAPTVKAIPIKQLREWQRQYGNKCTYGTIMKCVEDWEKENEID